MLGKVVGNDWLINYCVFWISLLITYILILLQILSFFIIILYNKSNNYKIKLLNSIIL